MRGLKMKNLLYLLIQKSFMMRYLINPLFSGCFLLLFSCNNQDDEFTFNRIIQQEERLFDATVNAYYEGENSINSIKGMLMDRTLDHNSNYKAKILFLKDHMDSVEFYCQQLIQLTDELKLQILKRAGENCTASNKQNSIYRKESNPVSNSYPVKLNLKAIKNKGKKIEENLFFQPDNNLSKESLQLWNEIQKTRIKLIEIVGSCNFSFKSIQFNLTDINSFYTKKDLRLQIENMLEKSTYNYQEDRELLIELYSVLSYNEINGSGKHWINDKFENASLLEAINSLTVIQYDIMQARRFCLTHLSRKMSHCCYRFDKIIPVVNGPSIVKLGDSVTFKVFLAAFDSSNDPEIQLNTKNKIKYEEGIGYVTICPSKTGAQTITGKMSTRKKSGDLKVEPIEIKFEVVK
jgi:hypothetical protein